MKKLVLIAAAFCLAACSTHHPELNYKEFHLYSGDNPGNKDFDEIGPVSGSGSGFLWSDCGEVATAAVKEMLDQAKAKGGDSVYKVRFEQWSQPTCRKHWGWLLIWPAALGPWTAHSKVSGIAAVSGKQVEKADVSAIHIPDGIDTELIARRYVERLFSR